MPNSQDNRTDNQRDVLQSWYGQGRGHSDSCSHRSLISRMHIRGVIAAPGGAWFTDCSPDYPRDEALQQRYAKAARDPDAWADFAAEFLGGAA